MELSEESYDQLAVSFEPWRPKGPEVLAQQARLKALLQAKANATFGPESYVSPQAGVFTQSFTLGARSIVAAGAIIRGTVMIGNDCSVNPYTHIAGTVRIGNACRIAANVSIFGFNHGFDRIDVPIMRQPTTTKGIVIHDDVWIGANAVIVDGVEIGPHCVIAAGAVVVQSVPAYKIVGGNPARILGDRAERAAARQAGAAPAPAPAAPATPLPAPDPRRAVRHALFAEDPYAAPERQFPPDLQGWGSDDPVFARVLAEVRPALVVEVGTWKGASAIHMAETCRRLGLDPEIVCIDTWLGNWQHWSRPTGTGSRVDLRLRNGFPQLYYQFLSNVLARGCEGMITPLPLTGVAGAKLFAHLGLRPDLIYIDGDHEYKSVVFDLRLWLERLAPGGVLLGDDYGWPGVKRAVHEIAAVGAWALEVAGEKFVLRRGRP